MRLLVQRVARARISEKASPQVPAATIDKGLLVLAGFEPSDSVVIIEQMIQKLKSLRIFADGAGKMNLSGAEVGAQYLLVSQFTLHADCKYGNRPSFDAAAPKARAKEYYQHFVQTAERLMGPETIKHGEFGSDLDVELVNDGPVTLWLDSAEVL